MNSPVITEDAVLDQGVRASPRALRSIGSDAIRSEILSIADMLDRLTRSRSLTPLEHAEAVRGRESIARIYYGVAAR
jgi:hypothetical protein